MKPRIDLRFRPGMIIFVDNAGEQICQQFKQIIQMTQFDEVLQQCIALIQVTSGENTAIPVPVGERFPTFDQDMPTEPADLDLLLPASLSSIQLERRLIEVGDAGYPVPNPRPQIYIVGDARSQELKTVHGIVRAQLMRRGFSTLVCYVLDAYEHDTINTLQHDPLADQQNISYWLQHEVPNFCYFYEDQLTHPAPRAVTQAQSHYAAAESLFALIATGIRPEPIFEQFMKLDSNLTSYTNVGSFGTTLIIFPRESVLEYCSAQLGCALLQQWLNDIDSNLLPDEERRKLQERAVRGAEHIGQWISDRAPRPYANEEEQTGKTRRKRDASEVRENAWPSLDILKEEKHPISPRALTRQKGLHIDINSHMKALFRLFNFEEVEEEARKSRRLRDTWTQLVYKRGGRAVDAYHEWSQIAYQAWEAAAERMGAEVKQEVDVLWSKKESGPDGFERAKTYADAFDERLTKLQDRLSRLRETHERTYEDDLDNFERLAEGKWIIPPGEANITQNGDAGAITQVGPGFRGPGDGDAPGRNRENTGVNTGDANQAARPATHQHLSAREEEIANHLEQRVLWLQDRVPSIPTQLTISLPFWLAMVLSGIALYPKGNIFYFLALVVLTAAGIGMMNWLFWRKYHQQVKAARKDLLRFYRRHFAHRCEVREDTLRRLVMVPLRRRVLTMRERLDDISLFIGNVQTELQEQSQQVRRQLFSSPSAVRDIYIANGERLQKQRKNTIEDFAKQVTQLRERKPVEEWHQSFQGIKERLIESFRTHTQSILEMDQEQAREHIHTFTRGIIGAYLHGSLVDIQHALDNPEVWKEALDRAQSPLYQAQVGIREPQLLFVCGRGSGLGRWEKHWPNNTTPTLIADHHDWVLITALFHGGSPPVFNPDTLFPPRHTPVDMDSLQVEDDDEEAYGKAITSPLLPLPGNSPVNDGNNDDDEFALPRI